MGPARASGIFLFAAYAQQNTFSTQQASDMVQSILPRRLQIPSGSMTLFTVIAMLSDLDWGISSLQWMGIGQAVPILAALVAGFVEFWQKQPASQSGLTNSQNSTLPISVLSTVQLECFYNQALENIHGPVVDFDSSWELLVTTIIEGSNWLSDDDLNKGLEYWYWLLTLLPVVNIVYYIISAKSYTSKPINVSDRDKG